MPKKSKVQMKAQKASAVAAQRRNERSSSSKRINSRTFAFAVLANGGTYSQQKRILNDMNIIAPSSASFYKHQKVILEEAGRMATESMSKARASMNAHSILSFDGHYLHRRNANECEVDIMDERGLIVEHEVKTRIGSRRKGNYVGPSNMMESAALSDAIKRMDPICFDGYVHDRDNKSRVIMDRLVPGKQEFHGPNHAMKGYDRCWSKLLQGGYGSKCGSSQSRSKLFHGLGSRLKAWFLFLLSAIFSIPEKIAKWKNSLNHYLGDHSNCDPPHEQKEKCFLWKKGLENMSLRHELDGFLEETSSILKSVDRRFSTNQNESYHAEAAKFAPKRIAWCGSYEGRMNIAICSHNNPMTWKEELRRRVHADKLHPQVEMQIKQMNETNAKKSTMKKSDKYKEMEKNRRKLSKDKKIGDYGQKFPQLGN